MDGAILSSDCLNRLGLTQQPFLPQWQDAFAFSDTSLEMPLNVTLEHLRDASPPVLIKGEYGIGKSAQLKRLAGRGNDLHFCLIEAGPDTSMAAVDYAVRLQWQPHPRHGDPKGLSLDRYLAALCEDGMRPVLLVDDAHHLEPKVLGTLLNLKQHMRNSLGQNLGVVLAAERSVDQTLALLEGKLRILNELYAITSRPLNREQTARYLEHRLRAAGREDALPLDEPAIDRIQQATGGLPGDINRAAVEELQAWCDTPVSAGTKRKDNKSLPGRLLMPAAIVLVVLGLLASLYGLVSGLLGPAETADTSTSEARLNIPPPASPQSPAPSETAATDTAPPPMPSAPVAEDSTPLSVASQPEKGVPREDEIPPPAAEPEPTARTPAPAATESPSQGFDFTADFDTPETAEPAAAVEPPVEAAPTTATAPSGAEPAPATPTPAPILASKLPNGTLNEALWLMRQEPDHYTIQVLGVSQEAAARQFYARHAEGLEAVIAPTLRAGNPWYSLIIGVFPSAGAARAAIPALPAAIQENQPFIRRIGDIQEAVLDGR